MVIFGPNALRDELRLVEQRPETIRVAGEVMADRLGPLAGIDADKQNADASLDAIAEHARILYVAVREPPEGKGGCDDAHADEDRQIARRVTLPQQDGRAMIVMERRRPPQELEPRRHLHQKVDEKKADGSKRNQPDRRGAPVHRRARRDRDAAEAP